MCSLTLSPGTTGAPPFYGGAALGRLGRRAGKQAAEGRGDSDHTDFRGPTFGAANAVTDAFNAGMRRIPLGRPAPSANLVLEAVRDLERAVPGFDHTAFDHETLHGALQEYLDLEIRPELIRDDLYPTTAANLRSSPIEAALLKPAAADHVSICLPATTPHALWPPLIFHELWHLMAGHPLFFPHRPSGAAPYWRPARVLCPSMPSALLAALEDHHPALSPLCVRWCENDADIAAEHLLRLSTLAQRSRTGRAASAPSGCADAPFRETA